jgi:preprotein translocase subunit SecY
MDTATTTISMELGMYFGIGGGIGFFIMLIVLSSTFSTIGEIISFWYRKNRKRKCRK